MANPITQMIAFPSNGQTTPGYLAEPGDGQPHPGVVIIQEWWGLVGHIKEVAGRFARAGFVTLAPDLYHGQKADEPDEARKLAMELDRERAVREIAGAARYLQGLEAVASKKIGVVGWCMGGSLAIAASARVPELGAAVAFYGAPRDPGLLRDVRAPLLGLYGEKDGGIPPEVVQGIDAALMDAGIPHEIHVYPGAGHAFFNDTRPQAYNREAAEDAWRRTLAWLGTYLS